MKELTAIKNVSLRNKSIGLEKIFHRAGKPPKSVYLLFPSGDLMKKAPSPRHCEKHLRITQRTLARNGQKIITYDVYSHNSSVLYGLARTQGVIPNLAKASNSENEISCLERSIRSPDIPLCASLEMCQEPTSHWKETCTIALRKSKTFSNETIHEASTGKLPLCYHHQIEDFLAFSLKCFNLCLTMPASNIGAVRNWITCNYHANLLNEKEHMICDSYGDNQTRHLLSSNSYGSDLQPKQLTSDEEEKGSIRFGKQQTYPPYSISIQQSRRKLQMNIGKVNTWTSPESSQLNASPGHASDESVHNYMSLTNLMKVSLLSEECFQVKFRAGNNPSRLQVNLKEVQSVIKPNLALHMGGFSKQWRPYVQEWANNKKGRLFLSKRGRRGNMPNIMEGQAGPLSTTQICQEEAVQTGMADWLLWLRNCIFGAGNAHPIQNVDELAKIDRSSQKKGNLSDFLMRDRRTTHFTYTNGSASKSTCFTMFISFGM
ncbi:ATP-dependent DNA helicase [Perkinsela sp. CCAP 1560/4]|nr:ATP-dependent DNA helicase [Perkinsela sp. CCAP 1560/4]|eukprot:KNH09589.1 ATP-dependent DNA helicase [Perkinsela sp. CCAP 1560/4]